MQAADLQDNQPFRRVLCTERANPANASSAAATQAEREMLLKAAAALDSSVSVVDGVACFTPGHHVPLVLAYGSNKETLQVATLHQAPVLTIWSTTWHCDEADEMQHERQHERDV